MEKPGAGNDGDARGPRLILSLFFGIVSPASPFDAEMSALPRGIATKMIAPKTQLEHLQTLIRILTGTRADAQDAV